MKHYLFIFPYYVRRFFLNLEKEVFAEFSGNVLFEKRALQNLMCRGAITIDHGQCKKNIFSAVSQRDVAIKLINPFSSYYSGIGCNLFVKTKKPLVIQTSFLHTNAHIELMIKENIENPLITGNIHLSSGMLAFPYKPLYITKGTIYFMPHQLEDPALELIAKGKVKKYHVTLHANGSLQRPHISLESTPPLTEEQIITLLLAGSEEGSVALVMPTLIMQNLENLIFGPEQPHSKLEGYFKNLLGPLKHIRIVPSFFDQTGRGGLRGAFEIDVSDRLHALIEKNFSLSEDTRYEVEYLLSDDVTIRGIKDQRDDVGGEVEMRWKF